LEKEWNDNPQDLLKLSFSIGKVLLNLETKLTRLETANEKLVEAYEQAEDTEAAKQFHTTLDQESELIDDIISKISQLKLMKEETERRHKELQSSRSQDLEQSHTSPRTSKSVAIYTNNYQCC